MADISACLSHKTDDWKTPVDLYNAFMSSGYIDCFPFQCNYDEFKNVYHNQWLYINPPYSKLDQVIDFVVSMAKYNNHIALLIPVRTDTKYFKKLYDFGCNIVFIRGRLKFNDDKCSAPFPSMLVLINYCKCTNNFMLLDKNELINFINTFM